MPDKALIWLGSSRADLRAFCRSRTAARRLPVAPRTAGIGSRRLEADAGGWSWGPGNPDSRRRRASVFYVATRPEAVYVLHAFEKKTQKTSAHDPRIGRDRFRVLKKLEQQHGKEERG
jgi:phage-related protein